MRASRKTPPKRGSKYEKMWRCPRKPRKASCGFGTRLVQGLCLCPALGCERLKPLRGHRVEYASRQPFGTGGLLLQILKRGHDPALDFQDNLRRIRSFRRCACVGEYRVKSVRQVTLRWFCGGGGSRRWRAAERARTKCGASRALGGCSHPAKLRATFRCSLWVNQPMLNDWVVDLS